MRFASLHKSQSGLSIIQIGIGMILVQLGGILSLRYCRGYSPLGISNDRNASWQAVLNWCLDDRTEAGRNFSHCNWGNISLFANCNAWYLIQVLACKTKTWWIDDCLIYLEHTHHMWKIHCVSKQKKNWFPLQCLVFFLFDLFLCMDFHNYNCWFKIYSLATPVEQSYNYKRSR